MRKEVTLPEFIAEAKTHEEFEALYGNEGCELLFDYLTELEEALGIQFDLSIPSFLYDYAIMTIKDYFEENHPDMTPPNDEAALLDILYNDDKFLRLEGNLILIERDY